MEHSFLSPPPRVAALHDLSCFGRCALTVILPVLSAMGAQAVPVPTALLSTHTGGFDHLHFRDLTDDMDAIADHFDRLSLSFKAIYSGFLGSARQIRTVTRFLERFREPGTLVLVDPVMGDDGALYSTYTDELVCGMRELCTHADIITPNLTEACLLVGSDYIPTGELSREEGLALAGHLLAKLLPLGAPDVVITGVEHNDGTVSCVGRSEGRDFRYTHVRRDESYPGTGDLFASVLLGKRLNGDSMEEAVHFASDYVSRVIARSCRIPTPHREGIALEDCLWELVKKPQDISL